MEFEFLSLFSDEIFRFFLIACNGLALFVWMLTIVTGNSSQMDRLWPILPMVYSWAFLYTALTFNPSVNKQIGFKTQINASNPSAHYRLYLMTALATMWGLRLFYTFWRRGYYQKGHEDYRWAFVVKKFGQKRWAFHLWNFIFMGFIQNWILLGYVLPMWHVQTHSTSQEAFNVADCVVTFGYLIFYAIEAVADEQQWKFQSEKHAYLKGLNKAAKKYTAQQIEDFKRGFNTKGLFAYCRHPNYFGDMFLWLFFYLFTLTSQFEATLSSGSFRVASLFNYSLSSSLFMIYLFGRSVAVTEKIASDKYGQSYAHYRLNVGRLFPRSLKAYVPTKLD